MISVLYPPAASFSLESSIWLLYQPFGPGRFGEEIWRESSENNREFEATVRKDFEPATTSIVVQRWTTSSTTATVLRQVRASSEMAI